MNIRGTLLFVTGLVLLSACGVEKNNLGQNEDTISSSGAVFGDSLSSSTTSAGSSSSTLGSAGSSSSSDSLPNSANSSFSSSLVLSSNIVPSSSSGSSSSTLTTQVFTPCIIDVSNVGTSCSGTDPTSCDGVDIAHNYTLWPDPYECFVCAPGVTLLKGSACYNNNVNLVWNQNSQQCILNGQGYPMASSHGCSSGKYSSKVSISEYSTLVRQWYTIATTKGTEVYQSNAGATAYVVDLQLENSDQIQAAMSMGHGVLDGKCGDTFLIKVGDKYVLLLQTDIRAWSLELSPGANTWLDASNVGGTCIIPEVRRIDASYVIGQLG